MLPGFHCADDEAETLVVMLKDVAAQVLVELYYGVFETFDLITRAVRVINQGTEPVRLYWCASFCLDFLRTDLNMMIFDGHHLMERCLDRGALRSGIQSVGSMRRTSSHQHNPFVMLCDRDAGEDTGICYGAMLLYSGNFEAAVECSQSNTIPNSTRSYFSGEALKLLRFRVFYTKSIHGNTLHHLIIKRPVGIIGGCLSDLIHHIHTFDHFSKRRVLAVQVRACLVHNEEL